MDGGAPLFDRQAQYDAAFPTIPFCLYWVTFALIDGRPECLRKPPVVRTFSRSRPHGSLLHDPMLDGFCRPLNDRLFDLLWSLDRHGRRLDRHGRRLDWRGVALDGGDLSESLRLSGDRFG